MLHKYNKNVAITLYEGKGRGLVALKNFKQEEEILITPALKLSPGDCSYIDKTLIQYYVFCSDNDFDPFQYLALGLASFANNSDQPNAKYGVIGTPEEGSFVVFKALKNIKKGDEILINYNWDL